MSDGRKQVEWVGSIATKVTPFQCVQGYQPPLLPWNTNPTGTSAVNEWFKESEQIWECRPAPQTSCGNKQVLHWLTLENNSPVQSGDHVWLSTTDIRGLPGCKLNASVKSIWLPTDLIFISNITTQNSHSRSPRRRISSYWSFWPLSMDCQPAYTVKDILCSCRIEGQLENLVDWEGYNPEEQCWVPAQDILLIQYLHAQHPDQLLSESALSCALSLLITIAPNYPQC